jgi:hypothetical protein
MTGAEWELPFRSRFEVITEGESAWAVDRKGVLYRFDGLCFSRRRRRDDSFSLVPSWQTPHYGWLHPAECPCAVWIQSPARALPPLPAAPTGDLAA